MERNGHGTKDNAHRQVAGPEKPGRGSHQREVIRKADLRRAFAMNDIHIADLWRSPDPNAWEKSLERYWRLVKPKNIALEQKLEPPEIDHLRNRIRDFDPEQWYQFLNDEYFRWKYTDPRRYTQTTKHLRWYYDEAKLGELDQIRKRLLDLGDDVRTGLNATRGAAEGIRGLGVPGASGLLALMYPKTFGTVDQFVVKALCQVGSLPEAATVANMKCKNSLTITDGVLLIGIMQKKAFENNRDLGVTIWTPRKIDKVLWTYDETGRPRDR
jgi:hypothetical protein